MGEDGMQGRARPPAPFGPGAALAMLAGVGACLLLPALPPRGLLWPLLLAGAAGWIWPWRGRACAPALAGFAWAGLQAGMALAGQLPPALEKQDLRVSGRIVGLPEPQARRTRFEFLADRCPGGDRPGCGRRLQLAWYDDFRAFAPGPRTRLHAGARWELVLRLRAPRGLVNPGGFDSERNALARRSAASGYVRQVEQARELAPAAGIDAWRERMSARIARAAPAASARFLAALALGDTHGLDNADWDTLRAAGLTHLIAISGFHVGLVAGCLALLTNGLWRWWPRLGRGLPRPAACALAACAGAAGYAALTGFALPT
ncbi:MAG: ComEC/Rec2 family competence protein, partial [Pseudoxanthomonas sp.]